MNGPRKDAFWPATPGMSLGARAFVQPPARRGPAVRRPSLGRVPAEDGAAVPMSQRALDAAPPGDGEVIRTKLPETFDGIRYEIGRLVKYVQDARKDPLIIDTARLVAANYGKFVEEMTRRQGKEISAHQNKVIQAEGLHLWCRDVFYYVNDPANIEVIQTPRRMVKQTKVPREVIAQLMEPFYRAMELADPSFHKASYEPPPLYIGDCDEAVATFLGMAAALEIAPVKFRFGGTNGTLHHIWGAVYADGDWYDSDLTELGYNLGDFSKFEHYEELEIPL